VSRNGFAPRSSLVEVEPGIFLSRITARRYRRLKIRGVKAGHRVDIVRPAGGERSFAVQRAMHAASISRDPVLKRRWNLSTTSTKALAEAGGSSHGFGTRVDLLIDGSSRPTAWLIANARACGLVLEWPREDPNHFMGKGTRGTTPVSRAACLRYGLHVGPAPRRRK
jgi:hypothetical protein